MRILIVFAMCLVSFVAQGAFPPFQAFYGTNGILVTTNVTTGKIIIDGSAIASAGTNQVRLGKSVFVSTNGNDSTGVRDNLNLPFLTVNAAKAAAIAGDTVHVYPGIYNNASNLMKKGVNWQGYGATLTYTNTTNDPGWGIFDDRFSGSTTSLISGFRFIWSSGTPRTNDEGTVCCINLGVRGAIVVTNPTSHVNIKSPRIDFLAPSATPVYAGGLHVIRGKVIADIDEIHSYTNELLAGTSFSGADVFATPVGSSVYWELGDLYLRFQHITGPGLSSYSFWGHNPFENSGTNSCWLEGQVLGKGLENFYLDAVGVSNPGWRTWVKAHEIRSAQNNFIATGRAYLEGIGKITGPISMTGGGELWVTAQKISSEGSSFLNVSEDGILRASILHYEDVSGSVGNNGGGTAAISAEDTAKLYIEGGTMALTNGVGVRLIGGTPTVELKGMTFISHSTNLIVAANTNGLTLHDCVLRGTNTQFSIGAEVNATNIVKVLGSYATTDETNKITVQIGPFVTDLNLKP